MNQPDEFFLIFLATVVSVRIILFLKPIASPTIGGFRMHHYMYGIALAIFGLVVNFLTIYAIGVGLFVDELAYLLIRGKTHADNYSVKSLIGTVVFVVLVFIFRKFISLPF